MRGGRFCHARGRAAATALWSAAHLPQDLGFYGKSAEQLGFAPPKGLSGPAPSTPEEEGSEFGRACTHHLELLEHYFDFVEGHKRFKFYLRMGRGLARVRPSLFAISSRAKSYPELRLAVAGFFEGPQAMTKRSSWELEGGSWESERKP